MLKYMSKRRRWLAVLLILAAALTACGNNRLVIDLDLVSFIQEEDKVFDYRLGAIGADFPDIPDFPIDELPDQDFETDSGIIEVSVPTGINDIAELESMLFTVGANLASRQLSAAEIATEYPELAPYIDLVPLGQVRLEYSIRSYIAADDNPNQFWTAANEFLDMHGEVVGDEVIPVRETVAGERFLELFENHEILYVGTAVTMSVADGSGTGIVDGVLTITEMNMHIEARTDRF